MGLLPPAGWAEVAMKHDLDQLGLLLRAEMAAMEYKVMAAFERGLKLAGSPLVAAGSCAPSAR